MTHSSQCQPSHRWLTLTILSISLLTVMAGAAVAPALGAVRAYFADTEPILIQLIVSMPALFIILTNLFFSQLCRLMRSRTIALLGLAGMACLAFAGNVAALVAGCVLIGIATGVGVPYLNTIASIKSGKESTTTVMPLLAAALNGGQFLSPLVVTPCANLFFGANDPQGAYKVGIGIAVLYLLQTATTRHRQMLPPREM